MMARSTTRSNQKAGYIDARSLTTNSTKFSCNARPDHTYGSIAKDVARVKIHRCPLRSESNSPRSKRNLSQRAKLRHKQCSKPFPHSMTSSAVASSKGGTETPSAAAVFWLIAKSNFSGRWIGKSVGLAPCKIFPT